MNAGPDDTLINTGVENEEDPGQSVEEGLPLGAAETKETWEEARAQGLGSGDIMPAGG